MITRQLLWFAGPWVVLLPVAGLLTLLFGAIHLDLRNW